ncbi:MAG: ATP synthase subunit I [Gammaproteobacteria bacterium]|nr:ATP synthase subunit I [Gammaproteobacteria bacterium]
MNKANEEVSAKAHNLLVYQIVAGLIVAVVFYIYKDALSAFSAIFGALTSLASAFMLSSGVKKAEKRAIDSPGTSVGILYFGAVQRFILVVVLFIVGLKFFALDPIAMGLGFVVAQLGFVFLFKGLSKVG